MIPAAGGKPKQLTYHTADDTVAGWSPDGKRVLFSSVRAKGAFPTVATLFEIAVDGGTEEWVPTDWGTYGSYSADGKKLALMRHPASWSRKHYRGAYAADLWVMDVTAKTFARSAGRTTTRATGSGRCTATARSTSSRPDGQREGRQVRRPRGDEERQQHLEGLRKGRHTRQVTRHETGNLYSRASRPTGRPSSTRRISGSGSSTWRAANPPRSSSTSSRTRRKTKSN